MAKRKLSLEDRIDRIESIMSSLKNIIEEAEDVDLGTDIDYADQAEELLFEIKKDYDLACEEYDWELDKDYRDMVAAYARSRF